LIVVANAGPLIALAQIDRFALLRTLYDRLYIPPAVRDEVVLAGQGRPGSGDVADADWIEIVEVRDTTAVQLLADRLDLGESQAIVLALKLDADLLLIDEDRGRRIAEARGVAKTGTIGTLVVAKQRGMVSSVARELDKLQSAGFRMSQDLYDAALGLSGESR
jgi:predicted nucleic acid-binding protein